MRIRVEWRAWSGVNMHEQFCSNVIKIIIRMVGCWHVWLVDWLKRLSCDAMLGRLREPQDALHAGSFTQTITSWFFLGVL